MAEESVETARLLVVSREPSLLTPLRSISESNAWQLETAVSGWEAIGRYCACEETGTGGIRSARPGRIARGRVGAKGGRGKRDQEGESLSRNRAANDDSAAVHYRFATSLRGRFCGAYLAFSYG